MPGLNLTTIVTSILVLLLLALPFVAARLPHSRRPGPRFIEKSGPGPGFTYALVPPGGHPENGDGQPSGSWQWCLAFIPAEAGDGGSEMPQWWAPAPPWDTAAERESGFTRDADALQALLDQTSTFPAVR